MLNKKNTKKTKPKCFIAQLMKCRDMKGAKENWNTTCRETIRMRLISHKKRSGSPGRNGAKSFKVLKGKRNINTEIFI